VVMVARFCRRGAVALLGDHPLGVVVIMVVVVRRRRTLGVIMAGVVMDVHGLSCRLVIGLLGTVVMLVIAVSVVVGC